MQNGERVCNVRSRDIYHHHKQHPSVGASHCHPLAHGCEFSALTSHPWLWNASDGCLRFLHLSGSGQEADDFSCCDACIMNQCSQWPTCEQQRCSLLWLRGALSSPLSRSTDSTQLRGRPASMGIHVAKSQSVSERRNPRLCSLPHKPSLHPKKELFIWAWNHGQPAVYKCVELAFFRKLSCCFVLKDELPSHLQKTLNGIGCSCWLPGKDPGFSARRVHVSAHR